MAKYLLTNARVYYGSKDMSGDSNSLTITADADEIETTNFLSNGSREYIQGLKNFTAALSGFNSHGTNTPNAPEVEGHLYATWTIPDEIFTASGQGADGDVAFATKSVSMTYQPLGGSVGDASAFQASVRGRGVPLVRGTLLSSGDATKTATGNGTGRELGAVSATQKLYAAIHVVSISGTSTPTITVKIQSDDNSGFTTATDRVTFTAATAVGAQWATPVSGAITDTWWRVNYTISGTDPQFKLAAVVGIQ